MTDARRGGARDGPVRPWRGGAPFDRGRLAGPTIEAARALLGARLVREGPSADDEPRVGRIVEVEAYLGPDDRASHARAGRTARTSVMFGPPGTAYVYLVYGMYDCLNVVTEADGTAGAVLIRAIEPRSGAAAMRRALAAHRRRRRRPVAEQRPVARARPPGADVPDERLAAGPGLVAAAFEIDRGFTGTDLCDAGSVVHLIAPEADDRPVDPATTPRIGVAYAGEPWASAGLRFVDRSSPSLSRPRP